MMKEYRGPRLKEGMIKGYLVVQDIDLKRFADVIVELIGDGWQPFGPTTVLHDPDQHCLVYFQSMVQYV